MAEYNSFPQSLALDINSPYCNQLDIECFSLMMKDPTYCYKFYWLEAIVKLIDEDMNEASFDAIIDEMIANAWFTLSDCILRSKISIAKILIFLFLICEFKEKYSAEYLYCDK